MGTLEKQLPKLEKEAKRDKDCLLYTSGEDLALGTLHGSNRAHVGAGGNGKALGHLGNGVAMAHPHLSLIHISGPLSAAQVQCRREFQEVEHGEDTGSG